MISYRTNEEIELIRQSSLLVAKTLAEVARMLEPGVTPEAMDKVAETFIREHGGKPAFKGYRGFPGTLCVSPNAAVVHGIPGKRPLEEGDIVSVDCGVLLNGYYGDSAYTFAIGDVSKEAGRLLDITKQCLRLAIAAVKPGNRIGDISHTVQSHAETGGCSVVRELVGHGIGKMLHEDPEVPNFGRKGTGPVLRPGMVVAIEPMINLGKKAVREHEDGWTVVTADGTLSAHYEHTVAVTEDGSDVLSSFRFVEEVLEEKV